MENKTRQALELFVEKADLLENRNFVKFVSEHGIKYELNLTAGQPIKSNLTAPDDEALNALMTTFRMFIQDNDRISFGNMRKLISDAGLSENWKMQIQKVGDVINDHLDNYPSFAVVHDGLKPTAREIMEVFVYGDIAHTSSSKREKFLEWKKEPFIFQMFQHSFNETVMVLLNGVSYISQMSKLELAGQPVPRLPTAEETTQLESS